MKKSDYNLEQAVNRLLDAGISTGHADDWESLCKECIDNLVEMKEKLLSLMEREPCAAFDARPPDA